MRTTNRSKKWFNRAEFSKVHALSRAGVDVPTISKVLGRSRPGIKRALSVESFEKLYRPRTRQPAPNGVIGKDKILASLIRVEAELKTVKDSFEKLVSTSL